MRPRLLRPVAFAALAALACLPSAPPASAQDAGDAGDGGPPPVDAKDESTPAYLKAVDLQRKGKFPEAQAAFRDVLKKYPGSVHAADCQARGGDNCYMGTVKLQYSGPSERRIDVAVMGDGFQIDAKSQALEEDWAKKCIEVLCADAAYTEYLDYFNFWFVRLVSKDEGVDKPLSDKEKAEIEEKRRKKKKVKVRSEDFNTALDCKAAGPQGQVMADRDLVYQWLEYSNRDTPGSGDDALVIAFARFGVLGMGGGGVANVGRPDKSVTTHEFGHAFVGLLDEYQNAPGPPGYAVRAANATSDKSSIPWQHFLDKKVEGVGVFEGGATYKTGVWRPCASGCAMNSAGASNGYCPVCREAAILCIYSYLSPIDTMSPQPETERSCTEGDGTVITVTPMHPKTHDLQIEWTVDRVPDSEPGPAPVKSDGVTTDIAIPFDGWTPGPRLVGRDPSNYEFPLFGVPGDEYARVEKAKGGRVDRFLFDVAKLPRGRYFISCRVSDPTPWVLKDPKHLLEERASFWFTVGKKR